MSVLGWVLVSVGGYLTAAAITGLLVGAVIRNRNRQYPQPEDRPEPEIQIPEQRSAGRLPRRDDQRWPFGRHHN